MMIRLLASLGLWCLSVLPLAALPDYFHPTIASFEAGIYCAREPVRFSEAPGTVAGVTNIIDQVPDFIANGRFVPAEIGLGFGLIYKIKQSGSEQDVLNITMTTHHPPMGPNNVTTQEYITQRVGGEESFSLYAFDFEYELLPGPWLLEARNGETLLFRVGFSVVDPETHPELSEICELRNLAS